MKLKGFILLVSLFIFSCEKRPVNGKLEGRWQLMNVSYLYDEEVWNPEFTYYDFTLNLLQLARTGNSEFSTQSEWARFNHTDDSIHIYMIGSTSRKARLFGMNDTIQHFEIEVLTGKNMILQSSFAKLKFRKF